MSAADLLRLSDVGRQCVTFAINPRALDEALALVDQRRRRDELIERRIRQDAPRAMMSTFFGLSQRRYAALRAVHDMPATAGRCPRPSPDIEHAIYQRWIAARKSWTPITLVEIAESLGIPLRIV